MTPGALMISPRVPRSDSIRGGRSRPGRGAGRRDYRPLRAWIVGVPSVLVGLYAAAVLLFVAMAGDIGIRCVFGPRIRLVEPYRWAPEPREVAADLRGTNSPPGRFSAEPPRGGTESEVLTSLGGRQIANYTDYIQAQRRLVDRIGEYTEVGWRAADGSSRFGYVEVRRPPFGSYSWTFAWLLVEAMIFAIGAWVFWRRPNDDSARVFFWLCVVTVVAYSGGYHWSRIALNPALIFPFAGLVVFVPVVSLHFYLIFPKPSPVYAANPRRVLAILYGIPIIEALLLWGAMIWSRWGSGDAEVQAALSALKWLAFGMIGLAVLEFLLCLACLLHSYYRKDAGRSGRNQVRWILLATLVSIPLIAYLLWHAASDPARLGLTRSGWPMFVVSVVYTVAYAFSITRYKLMQAEALYNRGRFYVLVSAAAGLLYSGGLVLGALVIGEQLKESQSSLGSIVACATALTLLVLSGAGRRWFQAALDRGFHREKYRFDQAMRKMSQAVDSLADRPALGRRLLDAAGEVLRAEWGAIYLGRGDGSLALAACSGTEPDELVLPVGNPLAARFLTDPTPLRASHALAMDPGADAAIDAMIALGGEVAAPLASGDDAPAGLVVLGPKRSGLPYEDEEVAFLSALGSVAMLALRAADIQRTLESLNEDVCTKVDKIAEQQRRISVLQRQLAGRDLLGDDGRAPSAPAEPSAAPDPPESEGPDPFAAIRGSGVAVRRMVVMARKVAASPSAVLVLGESGTGKELLAEGLHRASLRADGPFVKVHCAALAPGLLESELFGHVKGAFTDAKADRIGRFEQADGGTMFLDEIGDIGPEVQTKLLRVLQEKRFERVGSSQTIGVDVRVVAATHRDLEALIRAGRFREDLYYRLNVICLRTPPLRERREDVFELAVWLLGLHSRRLGKPALHLEDSAVEALVAHDWPGNVRELENVIQRAAVLADGPAVTLEDLPPELHRPRLGVRRPRLAAAASMATSSGAVSAWIDPPPDPDAGLDSEVSAFERARLVEALDEAGGNKSEAARLLAMPRSTFFSKLRKHGMA